MQAQYYVHPSSYVDIPCEIGEGTRIWHFCHIMPHAKIGRDCNLGQNVLVSSHVLHEVQALTPRCRICCAGPCRGNCGGPCSVAPG